MGKANNRIGINVDILSLPLGAWHFSQVQKLKRTRNTTVELSVHRFLVMPTALAFTWIWAPGFWSSEDIESFFVISLLPEHRNQSRRTDHDVFSAAPRTRPRLRSKFCCCWRVFRGGSDLMCQRASIREKLNDYNLQQKLKVKYSLSPLILLTDRHPSEEMTVGW